MKINIGRNYNYLVNCSKIGQKCNWWIYLGNLITAQVFNIHEKPAVVSGTFRSETLESVEQHKWPRSQLHIYLSELSPLLNIIVHVLHTLFLGGFLFYWMLHTFVHSLELVSRQGRDHRRDHKLILRVLFNACARGWVMMTSSSITINFGGFYIGELLANVSSYTVYTVSSQNQTANQIHYCTVKTASTSTCPLIVSCSLVCMQVCSCIKDIVFSEVF